MNRLTETLANLKQQNKKALVAYLVAGDPDIETTIDLMHLFVEAGVDAIEIGVPFTDPIAEGPVIQRAHDRALKNNISLTYCFLQRLDLIYPLFINNYHKFVCKVITIYLLPKVVVQQM